MEDKEDSQSYWSDSYSEAKVDGYTEDSYISIDTNEDIPAPETFKVAEVPLQGESEFLMYGGIPLPMLIEMLEPKIGKRAVEIAQNVCEKFKMKEIDREYATEMLTHSLDVNIIALASTELKRIMESYSFKVKQQS